ncbi:MAG: DUF5711 family protein [Oscillospiraceae bacterium]|nr:DUF5711 family protein [Oscillospiraceae bacterium]
MGKEESSFKKRLRRKRQLRRIAAVAVIGLIMGLIYFYGNRYAGLESDGLFYTDGGAAGFPVSLGGDNALRFSETKNNLALLTDKQMFFYSKNGKRLLANPHGYSKPSMKTENGFTVTYDIGGNSFDVYSRAGLLYNKTPAHKILFCEINRNGYVALAAEDERYEGSVTVFDPSGKEVFKWFSAVEMLVGISLSKDNKTCAVVTAGVSGGLIRSSVYGLDFTKEQETFRTILDNKMALGISLKDGGGHHVIYDGGVAALDSSGNILNDTVLGGKLQIFDTSSSTHSLLVVSADITRNDLVKIDRNGNTAGRIGFDSTVTAVHQAGGNIVVFCTNDAYLLNRDLEITAEESSDKLKPFFAAIGKSYYKIGRYGIERLVIK